MYPTKRENNDGNRDFSLTKCISHLEMHAKDTIIDV